MICDSTVRLHRFAANDVKPSSLNYNELNITTKHGTNLAPWHPKGVTHSDGWMALLIDGEHHHISFAGDEHVRSNFNSK